jgi:hypothetical protein
MTMTERTITEAELKKVLSKLSLLNTVVGTTIQQIAFPPLFTFKEGEVIWVRGGETGRWVLRVFVAMSHGYYRCEVDSSIKWFDWSQAKPQTPTQKGEG